MKRNLRHFLIFVIHRPVVEEQYHSDLGVSNIKLLMCSVNKGDENNKDILSLFKDGHRINEIQSLLERNWYPFVKQRSLRTLIDRLGKTEKNLKKSKRNEIKLQKFYNSQFVAPKVI